MSNERSPVIMVWTSQSLKSEETLSFWRRKKFQLHMKDICQKWNCPREENSVYPTILRGLTTTGTVSVNISLNLFLQNLKKVFFPNSFFNGIACSCSEMSCGPPTPSSSNRNLEAHSLDEERPPSRLGLRTISWWGWWRYWLEWWRTWYHWGCQPFRGSGEVGYIWRCLEIFLHFWQK